VKREAKSPSVNQLKRVHTVEKALNIKSANYSNNTLTNFPLAPILTTPMNSMRHLKEDLA
jgi:hypothetical protein